jgi:predicted GNAT family N-acyltransferase
MALIFKIVRHNSDLYSQTVQLRYEVLRRPLGLNFSSEQLAAEAEQWHLACFEADALLACLILHADEGGEKIKMRQVAVSPVWQGKGIGKQLCLYAEKIARDKKAKLIYCHARATVIAFYQKMGYECVGSEFEEVGIPHYFMQKELKYPPNPA